ncbi:unnamed protein product [Dracunculus medinensis]|uniref:GAT domain-containing protein n=1 Tax=Dracunculus medinensis TaxID=318479 RepID=A0A0N4U9I4_DRAME|nr:unnamed protein product [Dracunculus medinensis]
MKNYLQSWNDAFRGEPRLQGVCQVYEELKAKGVEFPMTNLDNMAPIITPKRTVFSTPTDRLTDSNFSHAVPQNILDPSQHVRPTSKQLEKLRKELDIVNNNLKVLREMLSELAPGKEQPDDMELLVELHAVCKQMQQRILDLIRSIVNEEVTYELLILNDEFNNVFEKYDRYMSNRSSGNKASDSQLVDTEEQRFNEQLEAMHITNARHTRQSTETIYAENSTRLDQAKIGLAKAAFNKSALMSDREADEISQWLEAQETKCNPTVRNPDVPTEFDPLIKKDDKNDGL